MGTVPPSEVVEGVPGFGDLLPFQHGLYGYRVFVPSGWDFESDGYWVKWRHRGGQASLGVRRERADAGWSLDDYLRDYIVRQEAVARLWAEYPDDVRVETDRAGEYRSRRGGVCAAGDG